MVALTSNGLTIIIISTGGMEMEMRNVNPPRLFPISDIRMHGKGGARKIHHEWHFGIYICICMTADSGSAAAEWAVGDHDDGV
jgi:hypothetical protein